MVVFRVEEGRFLIYGPSPHPGLKLYPILRLQYTHASLIIPFYCNNNFGINNFATSLQQLLEQSLKSITEGHEQVFEGESDSQTGYDRKRPSRPGLDVLSFRGFISRSQYHISRNPRNTAPSVPVHRGVRLIS